MTALRWISVWRIGLILAVCIPGSARSQSASDPSGTIPAILNAKPLGGVQLVDANRDLQDALAKIGDSITAKRTDDIVEGLLAMINADRPVLFPRWDDRRRYIPSTEVATRILGLLPDDIVERASRQVEGAAKRYYEEGIRDQREEILLRTGRQYFHTPSGAEAWNALAALAFDRGAFIEAAYLWETLYTDQRRSRLDRPLVLAKAVIAAHIGGWKGKAADLLAVLGRTHADAKAVIDGRERNVLEFVRQSLAIAAPRRIQPAVAEKWESVSGAADGFAVMPECTVSPLALWKQSARDADASIRALLRLGGDSSDPGQTRVGAELSGGRVRVTVRRPGEQEFQFNLPATVHPVVFSDRVICRREEGISAVALDSGLEVWRTAYPMCRGDAAGRTVNHYLPLAGDLGRYTITAGDGLLFAVGRFRRLDPDTYSKFAASLEMDTSALAAFSAADGKPVWEVGFGKGEHEAIRDAKYLTAPTYWGGRLYAIAKCGNRYQAICLEARTGRRVWDVPVGPIPTHSGEQMSWQAAYTMELMTERASPLSVAGGVVYLTTNSGLVMALDAETGLPLWAYRYESRVSTTADIGRSFEVANMAFLIAASRRPFQPANPVLVVRGRVIVAPSDNDAVLALHALSGEKLWQAPRQGRRDMSAVDDRRILLSGPDFLFLDVTDGGTLKHVEGDAEDRPAVTRTAVIASGQGRLVRVELADYSVNVAPVGEQQAVIGRLVGVGGRLVAVNGAGLSVYLGFEDAWETLARRLKEASEPRQRMEWLVQRGTLALQAGRPAQAVAEFRAAGDPARATGRDEARKVNSLLLRSLLRLAGGTGDEGEAMRSVSEADRIAGDRTEKLSVQLVRMRCLERFGKPDQAVAVAQSIAENDGHLWMPPQGEGEDAAPVTRYQWAHGEIGDMIRRHGQGVYAQFDGQMASVLERARQEGNAEALLAAQRRWPHAVQAGEALFAAAESLWRRAGDSPGVAAAARVDRVLGAIGGPAQMRERAAAAQVFLDSRFRPSTVTEGALSGRGLTTNAVVQFGNYSGSVAGVLDSARKSSARFPAEAASFAGVTGGLAVAWVLGDGATAVLRSQNGGQALPGERRLCVHDDQSVRCYDVQGAPGSGRPLWSIGVPRVGNAGARSGFYNAGGDTLSIVTPEHVVVAEAGTGRELARKTTRELGLYPWTHVLGDGQRLVFANDRLDWIGCVSVPALSREWLVRPGGFRGDRLTAGTDLAMAYRQWWDRAGAKFLDLRTGRQVFSVETRNMQAAMNPDGFCAMLSGDQTEWLEFHDPRRSGQSLIWKLAFTNSLHNIVAFGDRHVILQERGNGSALGIVDIAGPQKCVGAQLGPATATNRTVTGVAWKENGICVLSGLPEGRAGVVSGPALDCIDLASGSNVWHVGVGTGPGGLCTVKGLRRYGQVLSILVVPHGEDAVARNMLVDSATGRTLGDFREPFGVQRKDAANTPEWAGAPVVLNGRVVLETSFGIVCLSEPL